MIQNKKQEDKDAIADEILNEFNILLDEIDRIKRAEKVRDRTYIICLGLFSLLGSTIAIPMILSDLGFNDFTRLIITIVISTTLGYFTGSLLGD